MPSDVVRFAEPSSVDIEGDVNARADKMAEMEISRLIPAADSTRDIPQTIPSTILIGSLRDARLRVISPIKVKVINDSGHFILEATDLNEFGYGSNLSDAAIDLQHTIAELYFSLEADADRLGVDLQQTLQRLQEMIIRVR